MLDQFYSHVQAFSGLLLAVIVTLTISGIYLVKRLRGRKDNEVSLTSDMTTTFRQMYAQGGLAEDEYRTITTVLQSEFRMESRDSGNQD